MKLILSLLLFICFHHIQGQTVKKYSYQELEEIREAQRINNQKVIDALEKGKVSKTFEYFSNTSDSLKAQLEEISKAIKKVKDNYTFSDVIVIKDGYNIFRCRYSNDELSVYQLDLFYNQSEMTSKILKFETKDATTLKEEYERRINSNEVPPPLPPNE